MQRPEFIRITDAYSGLFRFVNMHYIVMISPGPKDKPPAYQLPITCWLVLAANGPQEALDIACADPVDKILDRFPPL